MLLSLSVKNLALIENVEALFGSGLNVFSGETGAGKSLVIGSLLLALGGRAKADMVRDPKSPAEVELVFSVEPESRKLFEEMDIPMDEDGLVIITRRIVGGKSMARINSRTVNGSELKAASALLIDIHGQSEQGTLLHEKNHLKLVDLFGGEEANNALTSYREKYSAWRELKEKLSESDSDGNIRKREADLLSFEIREIEEAELKENEDSSLEDAFRLMNDSKKISEGVGEAYAAVSGDEGAASALSRAVRSLSAVSGLDKGALNLYNEINEIDALMTDLKRDMESYVSGLNFSPEEFEAVTSRLDRINDLKMKYGRTIPDIMGACREKIERLRILNNYDEYIGNLKEKLSEAERELERAAGILSSVRKSSALTLGLSVQEELKELSFSEPRFEAVVEPLKEYGPEGADRVFFNISLNPGEEMRPLKDIASGGELSRIMLAIKSVLADTDDKGTMIFDEIDAGISGRAAQKVSESLLKLSGRHQVILITHLPQIAAMADHHYLIEKKVEKGRTRTDISELDKEGMINELSRLLSGAEVTDNVKNNAREMKELADKKKGGRNQ